MPGVSAEQVKQAKEVDLFTYLQLNEPYELVKPKYGSDEFRTATHSSLVISKGLWFWNKGQVGGKSAIDYLMKVRGMVFVDAVETVLGARGVTNYSEPIKGQRSPTSAPEGSFSPLSVDAPALSQQKFNFYPPRPQSYSNKAVAYLQKRGISSDVINRAMQAGVLYESRYYNPDSQYHNVAICVFVGKDASDKVVFAAMRGIDTDFKRDKAGSNKRYGFSLPAKNLGSRYLFCFESPIDTLSHVTLQVRNGWDFDSHRLSLGGTSDLALISFLERNPQITRVILHLDNDAAGLTAARKIKSQLGTDSRFKHIHVSVNPPRGAKDYNELLCNTISQEREQKYRQSTRRQADILF